MSVQRIPGPPLIAAAAFGARLRCSAVARALARGLAAGGLAGATLLELDGDLPPEGLARVPLHDARALILAAAELSRETLAGGPVFELATRARQGGVPAYAVTASDQLDAFDARVIDLQLVLEARGERSLERAGRQLAEAMLPSAGSARTRR